MNEVWWHSLLYLYPSMKCLHSRLSKSIFLFKSIYGACLQTWVCVARNFSDTTCPSPPQDHACYVFNEAARRFAYWGRDSYLQLTGLISGS
jgi:hypothetical protein